MAEQQHDAEDKTEDPSQERVDEFRERGDVLSSREVTSVIILAGAAAFLSSFFPRILRAMEDMLRDAFTFSAKFQATPESVLSFSSNMLVTWLRLVIPIFAVTSVMAIGATVFQTRFNFSWKKINPDFNRLNPVTGLGKIFNTQALVELGKGAGKMGAVGYVSYLILTSEWSKVPTLLFFPLHKAWGYWGEITLSLLWSVVGMMILVAGGDYLYNFFQYSKQIKMTKQELKEENKNRESDPHMKGKMRRMAREIAFSKVAKATKEATVIITNPTHFAVALKYEMGQNRAPVVVAKGLDHNALRIREIAKQHGIPIVENKPLARTLYRLVNVGHEIPETMYKAVSEVIRYVFKLKGMSTGRAKRST